MKKKLDIILALFDPMGGVSPSLTMDNTDLITTAEPELHHVVGDTTVSLIALKHSCKQILQQSLSEPLMETDIFKPATGKVIFLTLNPLDYCALEYNAEGKSSEISMKEWLDIHVEQCGDDVCFLQSEKIYQKQNAYLRRFFAEFQRTIKVTGDLEEKIRPIPLCKVPLIEAAWESIRGHSILPRIGYHRLSLQE